MSDKTTMKEEMKMHEEAHPVGKIIGTVKHHPQGLEVDMKIEHMTSNSMRAIAMSIVQKIATVEKISELEIIKNMGIEIMMQKTLNNEDQRKKDEK